MRTILFATAISLLLGSSLAIAQQAPSMHEGQLNQLDSDKNGGISRAEYQTFMTGSFAKLDSNADGVLAQSEVANLLTPQQFSSLDANGDGRVSRNEFMNQVMKDFASADRGGDGQLN
ncbi:calcium sensor EFh [Agaricicola taiwanensis]|uniref:Calcium sensor EFh n=1 Tax=Agaricicola taiwanensis TaxID=591372 RepID=A0A8J2YK57_9RHOB|nr:EF-hand domain-containing protein [Agaricicola taiwanensis]GGE50297.1 calcium sensor EFh [Agaricicola taiwanensis]